MGEGLLPSVFKKVWRRNVTLIAGFGTTLWRKAAVKRFERQEQRSSGTAAMRIWEDEMAEMPRTPFGMMQA
jgi:hypothetical protein